MVSRDVGCVIRQKKSGKQWSLRGSPCDLGRGSIARAAACRIIRAPTDVTLPLSHDIHNKTTSNQKIYKPSADMTETDTMNGTNAL